MILTSEEYETIIGDTICNNIVRALYDSAVEINMSLNNMSGIDLNYGMLDSVGYADGYLPVMRDSAIEWLEAIGMDVQSDGKDF